MGSGQLVAVGENSKLGQLMRQGCALYIYLDKPPKVNRM